MTVSIAAAAAGVMSAAGAQEPPQMVVDPSALTVLEGLSADLSVEEADALMREAYGDQFTPTERMRALTAAAEVASRSGEHVSALAWIDWAVRETAALTTNAPELVEATHMVAIRIAVAAQDPLAMRDAVRAHAALELGWADEPGHAGVRLPSTDVLCPDVIDDRFVRIRVAFDASVAAGAVSRPARCVYVPVAPATAPEGMVVELHVRRVWAPVRGRLRSVLENGLDPADATARATVAARLPNVVTQLDREPRRGAVGERGYVRYDRPGTDDVTAIAYALIERDGVLTATRVEARVWEWPPERLGQIAETVLAGVLDRP